MNKKSNVTKGLIAATFLITIITLLTTANAYASNRVLFIAKGDDLDLDETTDLIIGGIKGDEVKAVFHQRIYDESGKQVYVMKGILKEGLLQTKYYSFFCPVFQVYFINVWFFMGAGIFKTTDTDLDLIYRNWFPITMPNTEGEYVSAQMIMFLSPTAEYCLLDPATNPPGPDNPILTNPELHAWVLTAVLCGIIVETPMGPTELPIGPVSFLTKSWGL
ncbi:MAG: hypothetical protein ACFFCY_16780 [Promethearchaeota archaeon]